MVKELYSCCTCLHDVALNMPHHTFKLSSQNDITLFSVLLYFAVYTLDICTIYCCIRNIIWRRRSESNTDANKTGEEEVVCSSPHSYAREGKKNRQKSSHRAKILWLHYMVIHRKCENNLIALWRNCRSFIHTRRQLCAVVAPSRGNRKQYKPGCSWVEFKLLLLFFFFAI